MFFKFYLYEEEREEFLSTLNQWQKVCKNAKKRNKQKERVKSMKIRHLDKNPLNNSFKNLEVEDKPCFILVEAIQPVKSKKDPIQLLKVANSSNIQAVGYRNELLYVYFTTGTLYSYEKVPFEIVMTLIRGAKVPEISTGKYFNAYIKRGKYTFKKVNFKCVSKEVMCERENKE
jgi:hypothetical protein